MNLKTLVGWGTGKRMRLAEKRAADDIETDDGGKIFRDDVVHEAHGKSEFQEAAKVIDQPTESR